MKKLLLLVFIAFTVECTQATENAVDHGEPDQEPAREPVELRGSIGRHPYLQGDLYAEIASLDLTVKTGARRNEEGPSISIIETNTSRCVKTGGVVGLEFQIPLASLSSDLTYSELVVELEDSDDAVSLLSSYVLGAALPGQELDGVPAKGHPRLSHNKWLVYDVNEILKVLDVADKQSETVTLSVQLVGVPPTGNATGSRVEFGACGRYSRKPPTVFLYHDFPSELSQRLRRSTGGRRTPVRRSVTRSSDQASDCHLHQWTVDFHQIGMKWIIAPILFKINYCHGVCNDPAWNQTDIRGRQLGRITTHGLLIVRALASLSQTAAAGLPTPSCVPTAYDAMNMIYLDRSNVVRVETFSQVIASSCGCA